jgi:hypothetical protein
MDTMDDLDLEQLVEHYLIMCAEAGIEPLPDDKARDKAAAMVALLVPALEAESRRH